MLQVRFLVLILFIKLAYSEVDVFFDRLEVINGTDKWSADIKKIGPTSFLVNAQANSAHNMDNTWKINVAVYRSDTKDGPYEKQIQLPETGVCQFLKKFYKKHLYDSIKDYSNMPHFDTCPVPPMDYYIKDCPFDVEKMKNVLSAGYVYINVYAIHEDVSKWFLQIYGHVTKNS